MIHSTLNISNNLIRTNYLHTKRFWIKRIFLFILFSILLAQIPFEQEFAWLKIISIIALFLLLLFIPKQEIGVDKENLYFYKDSILSVFCSKKSYKLTNIKAIKLAGVHNKTTELLDLFARGNHGGHQNHVEIVFRDNSSESIDISIYKKDLKRIIGRAKEKIKSEDSF